VVVLVATQVLRTVHLSLERGPAVSRQPCLSGSRDRMDLARAIDHAQGIPAPLEDVDPSLRVHRDRPRIDERLRLRILAVLGHALLAVARDRDDNPRLDIHRPDAPAVEIAEIEMLALGIEGDAIDASELR